MAPFFFRHISLQRSQIKGRGLRAIRVRLERKRRVNRRMRQSLSTMEIAAAEMEEQNCWIREENELLVFANTLANLWVYDCLIEVENDPLMRNAFERIDAQHLDRRNTINTNQARPFPERRRRP